MRLIPNKDCSIQMIGGLMDRPERFSQSDSYKFSPNDFTGKFYKIIFSAIFNLYAAGAKDISAQAIESHLSTNEVAKKIYDTNQGLDFLMDIEELYEPDNFDYYYTKFKKINLLNDLRKQGFPTSDIYEPNLISEEALEINEKFDKLNITDIFNIIKLKVAGIESDYEMEGEVKVQKASHGISELRSKLKKSPDVGFPLQGEIFNTITRGARKKKFYIRSASSGVGKTRQAVGDACYLTYPIRYNWTKCKWEYNGAYEKTLFIATEQEFDEIQQMILAYISGLNEEKIQLNTCSPEEEEILNQAEQLMLMFEDNFILARIPDPNIGKLKTLVREQCLTNNIENVFFDYIFAGPALLNEFRDLRIRSDQALMMMSNTLKELGNEMDVFVMSSTQTNRSVNSDKEIKGAESIRGAISIIDKADFGCICTELDSDDIEFITPIVENLGLSQMPNMKSDIFKVRGGRYKNVKIWSFVDLGNLRKVDLFVTDSRYEVIEDFHTLNIERDLTDETILEVLKKLNE